MEDREVSGGSQTRRDNKSLVRSINTKYLFENRHEAFRKPSLHYQMMKLDKLDLQKASCLFLNKYFVFVDLTIRFRLFYVIIICLVDKTKQLGFQ